MIYKRVMGKSLRKVICSKLLLRIIGDLFCPSLATTTGLSLIHSMFHKSHVDMAQECLVIPLNPYAAGD